MAPVLDTQPFEGREVLRIGGDQSQVVGAGDRRYLAIDERRRLAQAFEPRAFRGVPLGGALVVRQGLELRAQHIEEVALEGAPARGLREPVAAIEQLAPHRRSGGDFGVMRSQLPHNAGIGRGPDCFRERVRVEQIAESQRDTVRPGERSRLPA